MKKFLALSFFLLLFPFFSLKAGLAENLSGRILLDVERNGEAWYIYPADNKRYYLGRPTDAFSIMRELGLGIREIDFQKIAQEGMPVSGDIVLAKRLAGKIVLQVEKNGEAWYINPLDLKKYYLGRPSDAFEIMRKLGLGISRENLAKIHKPGYDESLNKYSRYYHQEINTVSGQFIIDVVEIDLSNPNLKIITQVADPYPAADRNKNSALHGAKPLAKFVLENNGFAGINATYFCSSSGCGAQNYYFFPIYDSIKKQMINDHELKYWTTGPIMAFDENNKFYYFKDSREFKNLENFENTYGVKLQAAIGNKPRLIENYMNLLIDWDIDDKQRYSKSLRNALAYKENKLYLVITRNSTVPELADIMKAMKMEYALNLDGGYSSALWYNDEYMIGPGRNIPNAIIFAEK